MAVNRGKEFENVFRKDWQKSFPNTFLMRLPDQTSGFYGSKNPCDFIAYNGQTLFLIECKACSGASIPLKNLTQIDALYQYSLCKGVKAGFVVWLYEKDIVMYVSAYTAKCIEAAGEKSIGIRNLSKYKITVVPSVKKKVFMESDYSFMGDTI